MNAMLSTEARSALSNVGTNRQGATISSFTKPEVIEELKDAGLIGQGLGLTRKGTIERERIVSADLDALF